MQIYQIFLVAKSYLKPILIFIKFKIKNDFKFYKILHPNEKFLNSIKEKNLFDGCV